MKSTAKASAFSLLALLLALVSGCAGLTETEQQLFDRGLAALEAQKWPDAETSFSELLRSRPDYGRASLYLGEALFHLDRPAEGLREIERALESDDLDSAEHHEAYYLEGRALVELGRRVLSDSSFRRGDASAAKAREARDYFLAANAALHRARQSRPDSYDVALWRAYALYRQENHRKALDLLAICETKRPGHWRNRFFRALALEGLHGPNAQSIEIALELAQMKSTPEHLPLYIYLADIHSEVPARIASKIPSLVVAFRESTGIRDDAIEAFLVELEKRREAERRAVVTKHVIESLRKLADAEEFREALDVVRRHVESEGKSPELTQATDEALQRWSRLLGVQTQSHLRSGNQIELQEALEDYQLARSMSSKLELKIALEQKINDLRLALTHLTSSRKIRQLVELLKAGKYEQTLAQLNHFRLEDLELPDRDLYHYVKAAAHFQLGSWRDSVNAFRKIRNRTLDNIDFMEGFALVKLGERDAGLALLAEVPPQPGQDEANRLLARHFADKRNLSKSTAHLSALEKLTQSDLALLADNRRQMGIQRYNRGDYAKAVEDLQHARKILDENLHKHGVDVYRYLGNAYFRLEEYDKAKRVYEDLINSDLAKEDRRRSRDAFLNLSRIHLHTKQDGRAYQDLKQFISLGGQIPANLRDEYGRLTATFADYVPLHRVRHWNYRSTMQDYNYTVSVRGRKDDAYQIERKEAGRSYPESWKREGIFLVKHTGKDGALVCRFPVNLDPVEKEQPFVAYTTGPDGRLHYASEVVAINRTVELPDGHVYRGCLQVRVTRTVSSGSRRKQQTRYVIYLAPEVGEVKQEIVVDDIKVAETVLSGIVFRDAGS